MNKKAYARTLEAFIAFIMTFSILILVVGSNDNSGSADLELNILTKYQQIPEFRECITSTNSTCVEELLSAEIPKNLNYKITINDASFEKEGNLYVESAYIQNNYVRLYYWED